MSLPTLAAYTTPLTLPSDQRTIRVRPWTVREEKLFLMAQESENPRDAIDAIEQVVYACTDGALDAKAAPAFDVEWTLLKMRCYSVGTDTMVNFTCNKPNAHGEPCQATVPVTIDMSTIPEPVVDEDAKTLVLNDDLTLRLRYPTIFELESLGALEDSPVDNLDKLIHLFDTLTETKTGVVYDFATTPDADTVAFFHTLSPKHVEAILAFLRDMPTIVTMVPFACTACGHTAEIPFRGLMDFFV